MSLQKWKWPDKYGETPETYETLSSGETIFTLPTNMTLNFRNFTYDFEFKDISANDLNLKVEFFNANNEAAFSASNIGSIGIPITFDAGIVANTTAAFIREFKNYDIDYIRAVITSPANVTCKLKVTVRAGGKSL